MPLLPVNLQLLLKTPQRFITRGNRTCSPRLEVSRISNFILISFRNLTKASFNYSCLHKMLVSYPKTRQPLNPQPPNLTILSSMLLLLVNLELLLRNLQHYSPNLVIVSQILLLLLQMNVQADIISHRSNLLQPTYSCHEMLIISSQNSANPQSSHCKPLSLSWPSQILEQWKSGPQDNNISCKPATLMIGMSLLTAHKCTGRCATSKLLVLLRIIMCRLAIYRLDHEATTRKGNLRNPNSCGVRTAFQRTSLWSWSVGVESGGGHPWRSPHRISLLLVQNSIYIPAFFKKKNNVAVRWVSRRMMTKMLMLFGVNLWAVYSFPDEDILSCCMCARRNCGNSSNCFG